MAWSRPVHADENRGLRLNFDIDKFVAANEGALPEGSVSDGALRFIHEIGRETPFACSMETGTGRTTIVLSHVSARHLTFALEESPNLQSLARDWMRRETVEWVLGPTQRMLPARRFDSPLDFVLIDGPHAYPFPELEYYFTYPHLRPGAWLVVDDVQIPTIRHLYRFLREEPMFQWERNIGNTAFFRRTSEPTFNPFADNWWLQSYNLNHIDELKPLSVRLKIWGTKLLAVAGIRRVPR